MSQTPYCDQTHNNIPRLNRWLIIGTGDVALRCLQNWPRHIPIAATVRNPDTAQRVRETQQTPIYLDLDQKQTLRRIAGIASHIIYLAPPIAQGLTETRLRRVLATLTQDTPPHSFVYVSTTGVYGNQHGRWIDETTPCQPQTDRAKRRLDAEKQVRLWAKCQNIRSCIVRVPGIYAANRLPIQRLHQATPVLQASEDIYTNHIHADDLAQILYFIAWRGKPQRCYNACDQTELKMGDWFDLLADHFSLTRPPRQSRAHLFPQLSATQRSFLQESRRIRSQRRHNELKITLQYPTVTDGLLGHKAPP